MKNPPGEMRRGWRGPLALGGAFFLFYLYHLAPDMQWGDSARLSRVAYEGEFDFVTGGGHGLTGVVGWIFGHLPCEHPWTQNLACAFLAASALFCLACFLTGVGMGFPAAALSCGALGVSHTFWFVAVLHESYALVALTFILFLWSSWRLLAAPSAGRMLALVLAGAAGLLNHHIFLLFVGTAFLYFLADLKGLDRLRWIGVHAGAAAAGMSALTLFVGWENGPARFAETFRYHVGHYVWAQGYGRALAQCAGFVAFQFPSPALVLAGWGGVSLWRSDRRLFAWLLVLLAVDLFFSAAYGEGRRFYLLIPAYAIFAILAAGGGRRLLEARGKRLLAAAGAAILLFPPVVYAAACSYLPRSGFFRLSERPLPHFDPYRYYLWPGKRAETGAARFARELRWAAGPKGIVVADYKVVSVLKYDFVLRGDEGIALVQTDDFAWQVPERIRESLGRKLDEHLAAGRRVILADAGSVQFVLPGGGVYDAFPWLAEVYRVKQLENCFLLSAKTGESPPDRPNQGG